MRATMRVDLKAALKARDKAAVAALRTALAAIDNAEAVPVGERPVLDSGSEHFGGSVVGLGAAEAPRRELTEAEVRDIVAAEVAERTGSAEQYRRIGQDEHAERLLAEATVLNRYLG